MTQHERLGKYQIIEVLGKGAMGVVYKGFDPGIDRTVAIKTVRKELIEDDDRAGMALARFRNEARAAGRLSHPGIVAVYDYGESDSVSYIAMEYVQGNSLREYFNRGTRFAAPDVVSIMAQLLEALQHAHDAGVWHRDIKPANLIIMNNGRLKIADFGIARIETSQLTQTGMVMGSPGYMAPEQYSGGSIDWRADIFAAGVVMHQLLTGARLFTGTAEQIAYRICHQEPPPPSVTDPAGGWGRYDSLLARALAKKPEQRYQSAHAFREAILEAYAAPVNPTVSEETIVAQATMPAAMLEPSNPTARTDERYQSPGSRPGSLAGRSPTFDPPPLPQSATAGRSSPGATGTAPSAMTSIRKTWPIGLGAALAVLIGVGIGAWLVARTPVPSPAEGQQARASAAPQPEPAAPLPAALEQENVTSQSKPAPEPLPRNSSKPPVSETDAVAAPKPETAIPRPVAKSAPKPPKPRKAAPKPVPSAVALPAPAPAVRERVEPVPTPARAPLPATTPPAPVADLPGHAPVASVSVPPPPEPTPAAKPPPAPSIWRDQGITMKVSSKIQFNRRLWSSGIEVETVAGVVSLRGTVGSQAISDEAEKIAAAIPGVVSVRNNLKVSP